ncbi:hypothetical protein SAG0066_01440 [Streptococcus agalactiae CCUG 38383]|nr:hypothetical protein SAG0066_01440 [Streptococcus agalactiae CCUG 38383]
MKGQKIIALAGLVLSCHFALTACHTQEHKNLRKKLIKRKSLLRKVSFQLMMAFY